MTQSLTPNEPYQCWRCGSADRGHTCKNKGKPATPSEPDINYDLGKQGIIPPVLVTPNEQAGTLKLALDKPVVRSTSQWLKRGEAKYLDPDNEWHLVMLDIADLVSNYAKHPVTSDPKEYAARAISFVLSHVERKGMK